MRHRIARTLSIGHIEKQHNQYYIYEQNKEITVENTEISVVLQNGTDDFICLTDMARFRDSDRTNYVIQNWMRARTTIEFLGVWEILHNPNFKSTEFDAFRNNAG